MSNFFLTRLGIQGNLQIEMMDYKQTTVAVLERKKELLQRHNEILKEKARLDAEVEEIKRELIGVDQILEGLEFVTSEVPPDILEPSGITDSIRKILSETPIYLVPTQIRDALQAKGINGSSPKNLLISVHKVLDRIEDELRTEKVDGKIAYKRVLPWRTNLGSLLSVTYEPAKYSAGLLPDPTVLSSIAMELAKEPKK